MSKDKYLSALWRQMLIVFVIRKIFFAKRTVLKIVGFSLIFRSLD